MASDIILYSGKPVLKETDFGEKIIEPVAFLNERFAGVRAVGKDGTEINSSDTDKRCVLAAIRGAYLASELREINEESLADCFCGGLNKRDEDEEHFAKSAYKGLSNSRIAEIKNFIPKNFLRILETLVEYNVPFDNNEISEEIRAGRIKKSSDIEALLHENEDLIDLANINEYGWDSDIFDINEFLNEYEERKGLYVPFYEEFLSHFNSENYKGFMYGGVNSIGFGLLSKLKNDKGIDINLFMRFADEVEGNIADLHLKIMVYATLMFKKSDKDVNLQLYSGKELEQFYGKNKKLSIYQKLPALSISGDIAISLSGLEKSKIKMDVSNYNSVNGEIGRIRENLEKRMRLINEYKIYLTDKN